MRTRLMVKPTLTTDELEQRYRQSRDGVTRSHWQIIWLFAQGHPTQMVAMMTGYSEPWIRHLVHRYNAAGPQGLEDARHTNPGQARLLSSEQEAALRQTLEGAAPDGGIWTGPKVATWMTAQLGRPIRPQRGWEALRRLGYRLLVPRPRHLQADEEAQVAFKKTS